MNAPRRIPRQCLACQGSFEARASDVRRGFGLACSPRCSGKLGGRGRGKASHPLALGSHPFQGQEPKTNQEAPCPSAG